MLMYFLYLGNRIDNGVKMELWILLVAVMTEGKTTSKTTNGGQEVDIQT